MMLAQGQSETSWDAVVRLVRGERDYAADPKIAILARHRRDRTSDAPVRAPLLASRDLQSLAIAGIDDHFSAVPSVVTLNVAHKMPAPQSPEPFSAEEVAQLMADGPSPSAPPNRPITSAAAPRARTLLAALAERFQLGFERQATIIAAQEAREALTALIALAHQETAFAAVEMPDEPVVTATAIETPIVMAVSPKPLDSALDEALTAALATLRTLSQQSPR